MPITPLGTGDFNLKDWVRRRFIGPRGEEIDRIHEHYRNSPLVQDTLFPLAGGPVRSEVSNGLFMHLKRGDGYANPLFRSITVSPHEARSTPLFTHELGHIADFRNVYPGADSVAAANVGSYGQREGARPHYASSSTEYEAHLFDTAFQLIRESELVGEGDPMRSWGYLGNRLEYLMEAKPGIDWMVERLINSDVFRMSPVRQGLDMVRRPPMRGPTPF